MGKVKVAIAGVGNCSSSLVQGVEYYKDADEGQFVPGLMHVNFGGYHINDIDFVAAFDVDANKVGKDLSEAIFTKPNCTIQFSEVPELGVEVMRAEVQDGIGKYLKGVIPVDKTQESVNVAQILEDADADVLISYMPVGSFEASRYYAREALKAGCGFVNCIPEFIVSDKEWGEKFEEAGVPCAGDDIKSQVGATILHRAIATLLHDRGVKLDESYQLNVGGNTDFLNMLEEERLSSKRVSKTEAVATQVPYEVPLKIGPSDYIPFLDDNKVCHIYAKGRKFGDVPLEIDVKLSVEDSPNSAGVVIDALRAVKLAKDRDVGGPLTSISAYCFKHPPIQIPDSEAVQAVEEFIAGERER
ncbi:inositol-3-phosphate synthase [candidate division MSBL1 archaeon SCGC-AAA261O19]|uniref:Inositol-3-phosphate synthase n=2 Tax=candidate division MSBL1 TaxID=215777 RepID=A0A133V2D9_9EURY|nr:inositol-3-phosphate synthase [candidate division MSBL1 archaeon SCGC-AAA261C02]KXB03776.1 inositol-3-phosphate synthase [candidate division MSBL1 archaeon SCGC-AAA261O19]